VVRLDQFNFIAMATQTQLMDMKVHIQKPVQSSLDGLN
jgi:hypothetical protein